MKDFGEIVKEIMEVFFSLFMLLLSIAYQVTLFFAAIFVMIMFVKTQPELALRIMPGVRSLYSALYELGKCLLIVTGVSGIIYFSYEITIRFEKIRKDIIKRNEAKREKWMNELVKRLKRRKPTKRWKF